MTKLLLLLVSFISFGFGSETYHAAGLMQFAQSGSYEGGNLSPEKCLDGHRQAQILESIVLINVKVIVVIVWCLAVVVCL